MTSFEDLPIRDDLRGQKPYGAPQAHVRVELNVNENTHPVPQAVVDDILARTKTALATINRYPDREFTALREALAKYLGHGMRAENIWAANGSNEIIQQLMQAFGGPGRSVLGFPPTYSMHPIIAKGTGTEWLTAERDAYFEISPETAVATIREQKPDIAFFCTPNNPTGTVVGHDELRNFLQAVPSNVLVVIDEAYVHFQTDTDAARGLELYREFDNVAVLHTFSKAYGLAGLRLGYAVAREDVRDGLEKVALPFGVTDIAQAAGVKSLEVEAELQDRIDVLVAERDALETYLATTEWNAPLSQANFVWLPAGATTDALQEHLMSRGIIGRAFSGDGIRISIGSPEANASLVAALQAWQG